MFGWVSRDEYTRVLESMANETRERVNSECMATEARARVKTLEDRVTSLQAELLARDSQEVLPGIPLDSCPECGGDATEWVRIASIVHAQHDGKVERVSMAGSRIMCLRCSTQFNLLPTGLVRATTSQAGKSEQPAGKPDQRPSIGVRLPGGRRTA